MRIVSSINDRIAQLAYNGLSRMFIVFIGALFYAALATGHVAAAQSMHNMHGMEHSRNTACITLCTSTTPNNESPTFEDNDEDKKKPDISFQPDPTQIILALSEQHTATARIATEFEPPPGLPAYILFSVFRP